jgi:predicted amidohydrolase
MSRRIWVSTTAFHYSGGPALQDNVEKARQFIARAALDRPDIVCLPETFASLGMGYARAGDVAEPVPGPITEMAMEQARKHRTNIVCPLLEKRGAAVYNSAVVINRQGEIAGIYEKLHPVTSSFDFTEFEHGVTPGKEPKVFDLDFGRIGILICFDMLWAKEWARLGEMGAEVVFWVSAYDGGFPLRAYAYQNHYYVVSAVLSHHAGIIDMTGEVLAESELPQSVIGMEINLDKRSFHLDFNGSQVPAMKEKYGRDVTIRRYHPEGGMTVESNRPGLTVDDLMKEFDLELVPDYIARHARAEVSTRAGRRPEPQPPRRVRAQYVADI